MKDPGTRVRALKDGLAVAKAILREAVVDDELFAAASHGTKAVKNLLG